jgi:hypothetical protein
MKKKPKEPAPLSDILNTFFTQHLNKSDQWFGIKLWQHWPEMATSDILRQTKPVSFQKGRLVLWVANSVELQELSFHIEELKDKINTHFERHWITDIHFTLNKDILKKREQSVKLLQKIFN